MNFWAMFIWNMLAHQNSSPQSLLGSIENTSLVIRAGGKPSTWLPPGGLVEHLVTLKHDVWSCLIMGEKFEKFQKMSFLIFIFDQIMCKAYLTYTSQFCIKKFVLTLAFEWWVNDIGSAAYWERYVPSSTQKIIPY